MDRRTTLMALGGALPIMIGGRTLRAAEADASASGISQSDYMLRTLQYGTVAKETSAIAKTRARRSAVQEFAIGEILEQRAIAAALTSTFTPAPPTLTTQQTLDIQKVRQAPDSTFDQVYLGVQVSGHRSLLVLQNALIAQFSAPTTDDVHIALIAKAFIENHLYILHRLSGSSG